MSFPRYPEYKDSGVEWLGEVPGHWTVTPLKYVVHFRSGGTPSKDRRAYWDGSIPWASSKDMKTETLSETIDHITELAIEEGAAALLPAGTVIVVVRGMILARAFPIALAGAELSINQDLKALESTGNVSAAFLAWYLRGTSDESLRRLDEAAHGTKALRMEAWASLPVSFPDFEEQVQVTTFLGRETTKIDALVTEQQNLIVLLKEKRQALISHAVTKGLNPDVPMKDSGVAWLGEVPAHWRVCALRRAIAKIEQGWSPDCHARPAEEGEWGVLKAGCVNGGKYRPTENKALPPELPPDQSYCVQVGDVLMSRASGSPDLVGSTAMVLETPERLMLSDKIFRIRLEANVAPEFFVAMLNARALRAQIEQALSGGNGLANNLPQSNLLAFICALPPLDEQFAIAALLNNEIASLDQLMAEAESAIVLLQERRTALISAAVTGKIDVRHLAASTEPIPEPA